MILPITLYGDPVLRLGTKVVKKNGVDLQRLINRMQDTMRKAHGVGLAAPQIGRTERLFVARLPVIMGSVFINPRIVCSSDDEEELEEGCLSIPQIREVVKRPTRIHLKYMDRNLQPQELEVGGLPARVIQHEIDHLDGVLFIDRIDEDRRHNLRHVLRRIERKQQG